MRLHVRVAGGGGKPYYSGEQIKAFAIAGDLVSRGYAVTLNDSADSTSGLEVRVRDNEVTFTEFGRIRGAWERTARVQIKQKERTRE